MEFEKGQGRDGRPAAVKVTLAGTENSQAEAGVEEESETSGKEANASITEEPETNKDESEADIAEEPEE